MLSLLHAHAQRLFQQAQANLQRQASTQATLSPNQQFLSGEGFSAVNTKLAGPVSDVFHSSATSHFGTKKNRRKRKQRENYLAQQQQLKQPAIEAAQPEKTPAQGNNSKGTAQILSVRKPDGKSLELKAETTQTQNNGSEAAKGKTKPTKTKKISSAKENGRSPKPPAKTPSEAELKEIDTELTEGSLSDAKLFAGDGGDVIRRYLKEIGRIPLLTHAQELAYARQIQEMNRLDELKPDIDSDFSSKPTDEEYAQAWANKADMSVEQLNKTVQAGVRAKQKLAAANLRLVVSVAKKYLNRGVPFADLIQEGSLGVIRGAEKFDPEKGYKFSTYAYWWIRQGITRSIAQDSRTVRLPIHIVEKLNKIKKAQRELTAKLGREPKQKELAEALNLTVAQLRELQTHHRNTQGLSLDYKIGKDGETPLGDLIGEEDADKVLNQSLTADVRKVLAEVLPDERERDIISLRYGLADGETHTLEDVAQIFNLSRERVRQIQNKAMRKLRSPRVAAQLKGYLRT